MTYERPELIEMGEASDLILGSGDWFMDADNETRLV
jgi:hypothetical protein